METVSRWWLKHLPSFYLSITNAVLRCFLYLISKIQSLSSIFVYLIDVIISFHFRLCGLAACIVDLDDQTSMHFWAPNHRKLNKPNLVIIHGYGADSKWQFLYQVGSLAKSFNLYAPDLVFFGKSCSNRLDRSEVFQAECIAEGLKKLGVRQYSVYGISYGGYVGYWIAEMHPEAVEKMVIVSSGIGCTEEQKAEQLGALAVHAADLLVPQKPQDLRQLVNMSFNKYNPVKWVPDLFLQQFINVLGKSNRKEKKELLEHLLAKNGRDCNLPKIHGETLLLWGDKDKVFPLAFGYQLQSDEMICRQLGPKAKLEILKETGHAANIEAADLLNDSIKAFILDS